MDNAPDDILFKIFANLPFRDKRLVSGVCTNWHHDRFVKQITHASVDSRDEGVIDAGKVLAWFESRRPKLVTAEICIDDDVHNLESGFMLPLCLTDSMRKLKLTDRRMLQVCFLSLTHSLMPKRT